MIPMVSTKIRTRLSTETTRSGASLSGGAKKALTAEVQAEYDAWFRRKVQERLDEARNPAAVFYTQEDAEAMMEARLEEPIA